MLNIKDFFSHRSVVNLTYFPHVFTSFLVIVVVAFAWIILLCPVSDQQLQTVKKISLQQSFPQTQSLAQAFLRNGLLNKKQYFVLLSAYNTEKKSIKIYPAFDPVKPKR